MARSSPNAVILNVVKDLLLHFHGLGWNSVPYWTALNAPQARCISQGNPWKQECARIVESLSTTCHTFVMYRRFDKDLLPACVEHCAELMQAAPESPSAAPP